MKDVRLRACTLTFKAFDRVHHETLLSKLYKYGVKGKLYYIVESYLSGREQCTEIMGEENNVIRRTRSHRKKVCLGVPQGSILGPFLFICYVNDFPCSDRYLVTMYADDTSSLLWSHNVRDLERQVETFKKYP